MRRCFDFSVSQWKRQNAFCEDKTREQAGKYTL